MKLTPKLGENAADQLRRALDRPENRAGIQNGRPPLHYALYDWLRNQQFASAVYSKVIAPVEVLRDNAPFFDSTKFSAAVRESGISFSGDPSKPEEPAGTLAHLALAYCLLQPEESPEILDVVRRISPRFEAFFSVESQLDADPAGERAAEGEAEVALPAALPELSESDSDRPKDSLDELKLTLASLASLMNMAVAEISGSGIHPSRSLAASILGFNDRFDQLRSDFLAANAAQVGADSIQTLEQLEAAIVRVKVDSGVREAVLGVLSRLRRADRKPDSVLTDALRITGSDRFEMAEAESAVRDLAELVTGIETIEDAELQVLRDSVTRVFGAELARRASRGLFVLDAEDTELEVPRDDPAPTSEVSEDSPADEQPPATPVDLPRVQPVVAEAHSAEKAPPEANAVVDDEELIEGVPETSEPQELSVDVVAALDVDKSDTAEPLDSSSACVLALATGRVALAYQIALCDEMIDGAAALPAALLGAAAVAPHLRFAGGDISLKLAEFSEAMFELPLDADSTEAWRRNGLDGLMACALVRPALLAPRTNANELLAQLGSRLNPTPALKRLVTSVNRFSQLGLELTPAVLRGVREHAAWADRVAEIRHQCAKWLEHERQVRIIYAPATDVWLHWLEDDGLIGRCFATLQSSAKEQQADLRSSIEKLRDRTGLEQQIVRADKLIRGRGANRRPIEARATSALIKRAGEAADLVGKFLEVLESQPKAERVFRNDEADQCRLAIQHQIPPALTEMQEFSRAALSAARAASATLAASLLSNLQSLFDAAAEISNSEPPIREVLAMDLLAAPGLVLDDRWEPSERTTALRAWLADIAQQGTTDWVAAFERHRSLGDHVATARLIDFLESSGSPADIEEFRRLRSDDLYDRRTKLVTELNEVRNRLNQAVMLDLLSETELLGLTAQLDAVDVKNCESFTAPTQQLRDAARHIDEAEETRVALVRERFKVAAPGMSPEMRARVEGALENRDFFVAHDLIDAAAEGRVLDERHGEDSFRQFFPGFAKEMSEFLAGDRRPGRELAAEVRARRAVGPLKMEEAADDQASDAARLLEAWYALSSKALKVGWPDKIKALLEALGFSGVSVDGQTPAADVKRWSCQVRVTPLADRDVCVIPAFGSGARGQYRILCVWERPSEDEIINTIGGAGATGSPWIVLYFGPMTEQRRRDLASACRSRRRTLVLLDDCLVYFLCRSRGARLPVLFSCGLPFTVSDPYVTTASLVPPEMFFGRAVERDAIVEHFGTNLVYGGRQLGKTALLRDIERRYHVPGQGQIVQWIDLQAERIGISKKLEEVWDVIGCALATCKVVPNKTLTADGVVRRVTAWLAEEPSRRILLLLDEADVFLESDSQNKFSQLAILKGLMDSSHRRFKVVFAGLHNVQRASRDPNTPLAHLGHPVCIGPLLSEREASEALGLVLRPLEALGYRFESQNLPLRILSYTNYYPSLIQIYCKHLLEYLTDPGKSRFDARQSPPFIITTAHLDAVQNNDLREKILDKFRLTLNLDPRYKVIALCMAHAGAGAVAADVLVAGVTPEWVREQAMYWWSAGFEQDSSIEAFRTVLDEMIGLGILRRADERRYALRSPNIISLLGTRAEIDSALIDAGRQEPLPAYPAATFRRADRSRPFLLSPLTAQQEAEILQRQNGLAVVCGSKLSGIDFLSNFVQLASDGVGYSDGSDLMDAATLVRRLEGLFNEMKEGLTILHVPTQCPWTEKWVEGAQSVIRRKKSKQCLVRVVFEADAKQVWLWPGLETQGGDSGAVQMGLRPWSEDVLKRWLHETGVGTEDGDAWRKIFAATGGWAEPMTEFARRVHDGEKWQACLEEIAARITTEAFMKHAGVPSQARSILETMAEYSDPISTSELVDLSSQVAGVVKHTVNWAERLSYAKAESEGHWQLTEFVADRLRDKKSE